MKAEVEAGEQVGEEAKQAAWGGGSRRWRAWRRWGVEGGRLGAIGKEGGTRGG